MQRLQREKRLAEQRRQIFVLALLAFFICVLFLALIPGQHRIEIQLVVSQISFQTELPKGEPRRLFLDSIRNIESITLIGGQAVPLPLSGQLSGDEVGRKTGLEIELPYEDKSSIQFRPVAGRDDNSTSGMELLSLELQNNTSAEALQYRPFSRVLELRFSHSTQPDLLEGSVVGSELGQQPLELTIAGYRLPELGLDDPDGNQPLTLSFQPDITQLDLVLPRQGNLSVSLPPLAEKDTLRWFWNVPVTQVAFTTEERRGVASLKRSAVIDGSVRLGEQSLEVEEKQFLLLNEPGIQELRSLQLIEKQGIEVRAFGRTSAVQVGIDPDFPIRGLRSNIIARLFRPDVVVAIVSFSGAMVASLLSWLIDNLFKQSAES